MPKKLNTSSTLLLQRAIDSGITSPKELANLMGNADVETGRFTRMHENHRYSSAGKLMDSVSSASKRFSVEEIESAVKSGDPRKIFKVMYENRKDLGNTQPGDGYKYHGRGYLQFTGRYNYTEYGKMFGVDLKNNPDIAAEPEMAAKLAIAFWKHEVPKHLRENVREAAIIINGGTNGMEARILRSKEWRKVITPDLILEMQQKTNQEKQQNTSYSDEKLDADEKKRQSKYEETRSMLQGLLNDTDGSYAKKLLANNQEEVASFSEKIQGRIEQTKLQELTERESRNTLQQEEQQRNFSRSV